MDTAVSLYEKALMHHTNWLCGDEKKQRQQYKFFHQQGKKSHMTQERIQTLNGVGFAWLIIPKRVNSDAWLEALKASTTAAIYGSAARQEIANYIQTHSKVE
jgi:hypothetical protein